ncbi:3'-to-5' exoribonuclease RNase R [Methanosarcina horonobensis HB-1 = JCM 15518]|uniref:3'-to-5' exoribonuclease RNase R n=2 Tax=Methanosarcina horonobensis TaxID=418008 RepID=A0A0E3S7J5_9EURY|nr:RNB domain-containing ribonuclease [Methanosarcina horonobensis]AKB77354.1 3'-to-5' exoribonuclease RNase R [Methanosarcina horonobensis HB-1 = JCM 15518]
MHIRKANQILHLSDTMPDMLRGITIDDVTTRDMDDAIWVETMENGGWHVVVMITDVAKVIHKHSELDQLAISRVETRYYANGNSPMLPRRLADGKFSLWPGESKYVLVVDIILGMDLSIREIKISRTAMTSEAKIAFSDVPGILSDKEHTQHALIKLASQLANGLLMQRRNHGALAFYDLGKGLVTSEEGSLRQLKRREDTIGYVIIQELMILANMAVAEYAVKNDIPILFRNHTARSATPEREDLLKLLESIAVIPEVNIATVRHTAYMMLNRAEYGPVILGHFGLNLGAYTHFTSPIRRYADLVNHQQIRAYIRNEPLPHSKEEIQAIASHINLKHLENDKAKSEYMKEKAYKEAEFAILRNRIENASDTDFERITKFLIRKGGDCPEAYRDVFQKRLGKLPIICTGLVLLQAPDGERWTELKRAVLEELATAPHHAVSIFDIAQHIPGWQMPIYEVTETARGNIPVFTALSAIRVGDREYQSAAYEDLTKKGAMQRASVDLLATILGLPTPDLKTKVADLPASKGEMTINTSKDPIFALQEYCQAKKLPLPAYSFETEGSTNKPTFTCTCTFGSSTSTGQAGKKQRAKRLAARAMIYTLVSGS